MHLQCQLILFMRQYLFQLYVVHAGLRHITDFVLFQIY